MNEPAKYKKHRENIFFNVKQESSSSQMNSERTDHYTTTHAKYIVDGAHVMLKYNILPLFWRPIK